MSYPKIKLLIWRFFQYLIFFFRSKSKWRIHSPFVYELVTKVFPNKPTIIGKVIESKRNQLKSSNQIIEIQDFGAGYNNQKINITHKSLKEVVNSSARNRKEGELLYRILQFHKPKVFLELGTNLGFSTAYIAHALNEIYPNDYQLITIEGSFNLQNYAIQLLKELNLQAVFINDTFDNYLNNNNLFHFDGIFIDGNHTYEATLRYFNILKKQVSNGGFIIFDDIYWNSAMKQAWNQIIMDSEVNLSIDLYNFGMVYLKKNQAKEHFKVWY